MCCVSLKALRRHFTWGAVGIGWDWYMWAQSAIVDTNPGGRGIAPVDMLPKDDNELSLDCGKPSVHSGFNMA